MFCSKCGNELPDTAIFCSKCGNRVAVESEKDSGNINIKLSEITSEGKDAVSNAKDEIRNKLKNTIESVKLDMNKNEQVSENEVLGKTDETIDLENDPYVFGETLNNREYFTGVLKIVFYIPVLIGGIKTWSFINNGGLSAGESFVAVILQFLMEIGCWLALAFIISGAGRISKYRMSNLKPGCDKKKLLALEIMETLIMAIGFWSYVNPSDLRLAQWMGRILVGGIGNILTCFATLLVCSAIAEAISYYKKKNLITTEPKDFFDEE